MPYFATSQEWLRQSALLLEARPTTTRITTKYSITKPKPRKSKDAAASDTPSTTKPPRGDLTIKTYDPVSGTTLKYRTTKAAEVGRLVLCLGRLGTRMTGSKGDPADVEIAAPASAPAPAAGEDVVMADERAATPAPPAAAAAATAETTKAAAGGGGVGKGKKKKGKK